MGGGDPRRDHKSRSRVPAAAAGASQAGRHHVVQPDVCIRIRHAVSGRRVSIIEHQGRDAPGPDDAVAGGRQGNGAAMRCYDVFQKDRVSPDSHQHRLSRHKRSSLRGLARGRARGPLMQLGRMSLSVDCEQATGGCDLDRHVVVWHDIAGS